MSGLSNASAAAGFMQGANFMEGMKDRNIQRDRQAKADARADESWEMGLEDRERRMVREEKADARADEQYVWSKQDRQKLLEEEFYKTADELAMFIDNGGDLAQHPKFAKMQQIPGMIDALVSGELPLESPEVAELVGMISPDMMAESEADLTGIAGVTRGKKPGTVVVAVRRADGKVVPKTERHSSADDDPVRQYEVDGLMQRGMAYANLPKVLQDPKQRAAYMKARGLTTTELPKGAGEYERLVYLRSKTKPGSEEYNSYTARMEALSHVKGPGPKVTPVKDNMGNEQLVYTEPGGYSEWIDPGLSPSQLKEEKERYADEKIGELTNWYTSDANTLKPYGGTESAARQHFEKEFEDNYRASRRQQQTAGGAGLSHTPRAPASAPAPAPEQAAAPQQAAPATPQQAAPKPQPTERHLSMLAANPDKAQDFFDMFGFVPEGYEKYLDGAATAAMPDVPRPGA